MKLSSRTLPLLFFFAKYVPAEGDDDKYCRNSGTLTHQNGLWSDDWPNSQEDAKALCEGTTSLTDYGEICIDGRVTYRQMVEDLGFANIFAPAAETISVQGHLVSATGNVVLGGQAFFLYDFVSSYTIDGTDYVAGPDMIDNMLAVSMGTIDKVCFLSNFTQPESFYQITHKTSSTKRVDKELLKDANLVLGNKYTFTIETHAETEEPSGIVATISKARMALFKFASGLSTPAIVLLFVPVFPLTGLLRQIIVGTSTFSTLDHPQPLAAPDQDVENIQIDAPWSSLMNVMEDGIFTDMPILMGAVIKRISASESSNGCWKEEMAAIDLQMPVGRLDGLLEFTNDVLFPALDKLGEVSLHFGKRIPGGTDLLAAALDKFESCGASVNLTPDPCYHPGCTRSTTITDFVFPPAYYEFD